MALIFLDGFDKYGPANSNSTAVQALLQAGEWTVAGSSNSIVAGLSTTGYALSITTGGTPSKRSLISGNTPRLIGGVRFSHQLNSSNGIQFLDNVTNQAGIQFNSTGTFSVRNGSFTAGTILGTSAAAVTAGSVHYLEWDITFANAGSYQLWLDGVSILSGSGDTTATANAYATGLEFSSNGTLIIDDIYLFDNTGTTNNAVLLTSPRIETQFPTGDGAVQFAAGAAILGTTNRTSTTTPGLSGTNAFRLMPFAPAVNMTLNSISCGWNGTNGTIQIRPLIYSDNAGVPNTLMSTGAVVVGVTTGAAVTLPLTTPQSLAAGTRYWLGFMSDVSVAMLSLDNNPTAARTATVTFSSGAPGTAPATSANVTSQVWGNVTVTGANWYEASRNPTEGSLSYVYEATVGEEDLYTYPALSAPPSAIYAVAVKASVAKSDAGAKTVSMRMKSGATDSAGTMASAAPATSYGWLTSHFPLDPNGSVAWTQSALNAAQSGVKVES